VGQWFAKQKQEHAEKKAEKEKKKAEEKAAKEKKKAEEKAEKERKKAEEAKKPKEPGFLGKTWNKVKTGVAAAKDSIANSGVGQWFAKQKQKHAEKKAEKARKKAEEAKKPKEPGFISKTWDKIKTGATAAKDAVADSKFGKAVSKGWNNVKTGVGKVKAKASKFVDTVSGEFGKAKDWAGKQIAWGKGMLDKGKAAWNKIKDDFSDNEAERRIQLMSETDEKYRERLNNLMEELKNNEGLKEIQSSVESGEIDEMLDDLEKGKKDDSSILSTIGGKMESNASTVKEKASDHFSLSDKTGNILGGVVSGGGTLLKTADNVKGVVKNFKQANAVQNAVKGSDNADLQQVAGNIAAESNKQAAGGIFDAAENLVGGAQKIGEKVPGAKLLAKTGGTVLKGLIKGGKFLLTSGMDKKTRKAGIKHALGGVAVYKKLKEKYKMKAPEMRYAIRRVLGMRSDDDVASSDKAVLSGKVTSMKESGNKHAAALMNASGAKTKADLYRKQGGKAQIERRAY
jgi:hypothetical protein